jgi:hypothetical protein
MNRSSPIDAALVAPLTGPLPGVTVCVRAGVATAVANVTNTRKFRCLFMPTCLSWFSVRSPRRSRGWAEIVRCLPAVGMRAAGN